MDTRSTAQDLDRVREAFNETTLNYLGDSYGTRLGAVYASMYPERVRAFVLDGAVPWSPSLTTAERNAAARFGSELQAFFDFCDEAPCRSAWGPLASERVVLEQVLEEINRFVSYLRRLHFRRDRSAGGVECLDVRRLGESRAKRSPVREEGDVPRENARRLDERRSGASANQLIECLDEPLPRGFSTAALKTLAADLAAQAPLLADSMLEDVAFCLPLPARPPSVAASASRAAPMLVFNSFHDLATPLEGAQRFVDELQNGSHLVIYEGEGHGALQRSTSPGNWQTAFSSIRNRHPSICIVGSSLMEPYTSPPLPCRRYRTCSPWSFQALPRCCRCTQQSPACLREQQRCRWGR